MKTTVVLAAVLACALAASSVTNVWYVDGECGGDPDLIAFYSPSCEPYDCVGGDVGSQSAVCVDSYADPTYDSVYINTVVYNTDGCTGGVQMAYNYKSGSCVPSSDGVSRAGIAAFTKMTCDDGFKSFTCTDDACTDCTADPTWDGFELDTCYSIQRVTCTGSSTAATVAASMVVGAAAAGSVFASLF